MSKNELHFFASMNTANGFQSYFKEIFDPKQYNRSYILKGGPGSGKSSLMKYKCLVTQPGPSWMALNGRMLTPLAEDYFMWILIVNKKKESPSLQHITINRSFKKMVSL